MIKQQVSSESSKEQLENIEEIDIHFKLLKTLEQQEQSSEFYKKDIDCKRGSETEVKFDDTHIQEKKIFKGKILKSERECFVKILSFEDKEQCNKELQYLKNQTKSHNNYLMEILNFYKWSEQDHKKECKYKIIVIYDAIENPQSLWTKLDDPQFDEPKIKFLLIQTLVALKNLQAHKHSLREIKPQDILIKAENEYRICDFNTARIAENQLHEDHISTVESKVREYFSPEIRQAYKFYDRNQAIGQTILDLERSSVFSLGLTILQLITKKKNFTGWNKRKQIPLLAQIIAQQVSDSDLRSCLRRMLEYNPRERANINEALSLLCASKFSGKSLQTQEIHPFQTFLDNYYSLKDTKNSKVLRRDPAIGQYRYEIRHRTHQTWSQVLVQTVNGDEKNQRYLQQVLKQFEVQNSSPFLRRFDQVYLRKTQFLDSDVFEYYFVFDQSLPTLDVEIRERSKRSAHFSSPEILSILDQTLQAAVSLEESQITPEQFDLRPHNLLFNSATGHIQLIDTGISNIQLSLLENFASLKEVLRENVRLNQKSPISLDEPEFLSNRQKIADLLLALALGGKQQSPANGQLFKQSNIQQLMTSTHLSDRVQYLILSEYLLSLNSTQSVSDSAISQVQQQITRKYLCHCIQLKQKQRAHKSSQLPVNIPDQLLQTTVHSRSSNLLSRRSVQVTLK